MTATRALLLGAGLLALAAGGAWADQDTVSGKVALPVVPVTVDPRKGQGQTGPAQIQVPPPGTIVISPGETKAVMVSAGNVNRIITPFTAPDIITTAAPDTFTVRSNVVYASPSGEAPISLYITEKGDESQAINLILGPNPKVASREIRLVMAGAQGAARSTGSVRQAGEWERNQPYEGTLTELLAKLAKGSVPQGYDLAEVGDPSQAPRCAQPTPFRVDFHGGQHLTGGQLEVWVGRVHHGGSREAEYAETGCAGDPDVRAVALWPSPRLRPGGMAEIYVVRSIPSPAERTSPRPSLIEVRHGGG